MTLLRVTRTVPIPDPLRISRYQKNPELGPRLLFFSGGTALNGLCRELKNYTHNSIHLVTPFDSGGSSAKLRNTFNMPAIGDLRSRLIALADETVLGAPDIYQLFSFRLPTQSSIQALNDLLTSIVNGRHQLMSKISEPMRGLISIQLKHFVDYAPIDFDLRGASIGNLILAGGYLNNHKQIDSIIFLFSKLVNVQGTVKSIVNDNLHLRAVLQDGSEILGQHKLTGKEHPPLDKAIKELSLSASLDQYLPTTTKLSAENQQLISQAELICYPMGSFFSSILANLLPKGVGRAIVDNDNPKVYIPNLGNDPEQHGLSLQQSIEKLLNYLRLDLTTSVATSQLLNLLIIDSKNGNYPGGVPYPFLEENQIVVIDLPLIDPQSGYYNNQKLVSALLSIT